MRIFMLVLVLSVSVGCEDEAPEAPAAATEAAGQSDPSGTPEAADPHAGLDIDRPSARGNLGGPPVGGIAWEIPAPFQAQPPASQMRAAEYLFPEEEGERAATMTVFYFGQGQGGSVEANIARWVGQFQLPEGVQPSISKREVGGLEVTVIDVTGTFTGGDMGSTGAPSGDQRMLGAIVEGPQGPVFFKMVGDTSLMARAEAPFTEFVESFRPE